MIKLEVEAYCQQCLDFCPDVIKAERIQRAGGIVEYTDTIIRCKYRNRCAGIKRFLEQQSKV